MNLRGFRRAETIGISAGCAVDRNEPPEHYESVALPAELHQLMNLQRTADLDFANQPLSRIWRAPIRFQNTTGHFENMASLLFSAVVMIPYFLINVNLFSFKLFVFLLSAPDNTQRILSFLLCRAFLAFYHLYKHTLPFFRPSLLNSLSYFSGFRHLFPFSPFFFCLHKV